MGVPSWSKVARRFLGRGEPRAAGSSGCAYKVQDIRTAATEASNQIAHAGPVVRGGSIAVLLDGRQVISAAKTEPDRMELHKQRQNSKTIWTDELLIAEYGHADKLFGHPAVITAACRQLRTPPLPFVALPQTSSSRGILAMVLRARVASQLLEDRKSIL